MKRRAKDRKRREKADRIWGVRTRRKSSRRDRRIVNESARSRRVRWEPGSKKRSKGSLRDLARGKKKGQEVSQRGARSERVGGTERRGRMGKRREERRKEKEEGREVSRRRKKREGKATKVRNRCVETGHGRSVIRWFRKSGRKVRERARQGKLEGVYIVSW